MPVSSSTSGWASVRNAEKRAMASAQALIVGNAHPVARRSCDHRLTGSESQGWVMVSKRAAVRPRRAGTPRRRASQWSEAYSASTSAPPP